MRLIVASYIVPGSKDMLTIVFRAINIRTMPRCRGGLYQVRTMTHDLRESNKLIAPCIKTTTQGLPSFTIGTHLDCEQFLFFFRFSEGSTCASCCLMFVVWFQTPDVRCLMLYICPMFVWCQMSDIRSLKSSSWHQTTNITHLMSDIWCLLLDVQCLMSDV